MGYSINLIKNDFKFTLRTLIIKYFSESKLGQYMKKKIELEKQAKFRWMRIKDSIFLTNLNKKSGLDLTNLKEEKIK